MKLKMKNAMFHRETVAAVIRSVKPANVSGFSFEFGKRASGGTGRAWPTRNRVLVRMNPMIKKFPFRFPRHPGKGYLGVTVYSRLEMLVYITAHELRHLWQRKVRTHRVWGAKGRYSERDADAYALQMVRRFRRGELEVKPC